MPTILGTSKQYSGFSPQSIPGLSLWLDAADSSSVTVSGTNVTGVRDKSGNGVVLSSTNGYTYPNYSFNSGYGSLPSFLNMTVASGAVLGVSTSFAIPTPFTLVFVAQRAIPHTSTNGGAMVLDSGGSSGQNRSYLYDPYAIWYGINATGTSSSSLVPSVIVTEYGSTPTFFANGVSALTSSNAFSYTTGGITVGNRYDFTAAFPGHICEFIIYSVSLTTLQRQQIEGYLAQKWGLGTSFVGGVTRPTQIPGLSLWLDGADSSSITLNGSSVTQWNDKSGNTGNATQSSSGNRPTFTGSGVIFNASSSQYLNLNTSYASTHSVYIVATSTSASQVYLFGRNYTGGGGSSPTIIMNFVGSSIEYYGGNDGTTRSTFATTPSSTFVAGYIRTYNSSVVGRYNGSQVFNVGGPTSEPSSINWGALGQSGIGANYYTGTVYEFLIFNTALTKTQAIQIEQYLSQKWGLGASLLLESGIHPFSKYPPFTRPFQPVDISNCVLWLDAADSSTITSSAQTPGASVSAWKEKVAGLSFTGAAVLSAAGLSNGLNVISFRAASSNYLFNGAFTYGIFNRTTFVVWRSVGDGGNAGILSFASPNGVDYNSQNAFVFATGYPFVSSWGAAYVDNYGTFGGYTPGSAQTTLAMYAEQMSNQTQTLYRNATQNTIYNVNPGSAVGSSQAVPALVNSTGLALSGRYQGGASLTGFSSIDIAEVLCFSPSLTRSQTLQVEGYLAWKWGLVSTIPTTHPFYKFPPSTVVGFLPTQISGCSLWLDAADSSSVTVSGTNVTGVRDKSGNGVVLSSTNGYTYPNNSFNSGYRSLPSFLNTTPSTGATLGVSTSFAIPTPFTVVFVAQRAPAPSSSTPGFILDSGGSSGANRSYLWDSSGVWNSINAVQSSSSLVPSVVVTEYGNTPTFFVNGVYTLTSSSPSSFTTGGITVGNRFTLNESFPGHICEVIIYSASLTTFQRQQVEGYLAQKWGLAASLPTSNPYAKIPPAIYTYANYLMTTFYANTGNIPDSSGPTDQGGNGAYWGSIIQTAQALNPIVFGNNNGVNINGNANYSCITTGYVYSASAGTIRFQGITDDGLIVNFNGTNVIYQYQRQGSTTYYSSTVTLPAGYTPIRITWYDTGGGGDYRIYFSINGGSFINDGTGVFYH